MLKRQRIQLGLAVLLVVGIALTGCATTPGPAPSRQAGIDRQKVLNQLGTYPPDAELTDEAAAQLLGDAADSTWSRVIAQFPSAARPDVAVEKRVATEDAREILTTCLVESGLDLGVGGYNEYFPETAPDGIAWYTCKARFPLEPEAAPTEDQLGYIYDYLVSFVVPCLEENGATNAAPPTREDFIAEWPNQGWFPYVTNAAPGSKESEKINSLCPSTID